MESLGKYLEIFSDPKYVVCDHFWLILIFQAIMTVSDHNQNTFYLIYKRKSEGYRTEQLAAKKRKKKAKN